MYSDLSVSVAVCFMIVMTTSYSICVNRASTVYNIQLDVPTCILCSEALKMLIMLAAELFTTKTIRNMIGWNTLRHAFPAILFLVQNNLQVHAMTLIDPTTFQTITSLKIILTGIVSHFIMKRMRLSEVLDLMLICCGVMAMFLCSDISYTEHFLLGASLAFSGQLVSSLCLVYNEYVLKDHHDTSSFYMKNGVMYSFGIIFSVPFSNIREVPEFSKGTWFVIFLMALTGLSVAIVLKTLDSKLKNIIGASCIILTKSVLSIIGDTSMSKEFLVGSSVILIATLRYVRDERKHEGHSPVLHDEELSRVVASSSC